MNKYNSFFQKTNIITTNLLRLCLIILFIMNFINKNHTQDLLIISTFLLTFYPSILAKKFKILIPYKLELIITLYIFSSQVLGEIGGFYIKFTWWDIMLHSISGTILGLIGFLFVYLLNKKGDTNTSLSPIFVVIVAFCFSLTLAVFWEFFEFGGDRLFGLNMQRFRMPGEDGLTDTMQDLLVNALCSLIACIIGWIYIKRKKDTLLNNYFDKWVKS